MSSPIERFMRGAPGGCPALELLASAPGRVNLVEARLIPGLGLLPSGHPVGLPHQGDTDGPRWSVVFDALQIEVAADGTPRPAGAGSAQAPEVVHPLRDGVGMVHLGADALLFSCVRGAFLGAPIDHAGKGAVLLGRFAYEDVASVTLRRPRGAFGRGAGGLVVAASGSASVLRITVLGTTTLDHTDERAEGQESYLDELCAAVATARLETAPASQRDRLQRIATGGERLSEDGDVVVRFDGRHDVDEEATAGVAPVCASCGLDLRPGARFCGNCGSNVAPSGATTPPAVPPPAAPPQPASASAPGLVDLPPPAPGTAVTATLPTGPSPRSTGAGNRRRRGVLIALGTVAALLIAGGGVGTYLLMSGGDQEAQGIITTIDEADAEPPVTTESLTVTATGGPITAPGRTTAEVAPPPQPQETARVSLVEAFLDDDLQEDPGDVCFGPGLHNGRPSYMDVNGVRVSDDLIQCGTRNSPADAEGIYRFRSEAIGISGGARITGVEGDFAIDESAISQRGSVVEWTVSYGGVRICRARSSWGSPGRCNVRSAGYRVRPGGELVIAQRVVSATSWSNGFWAGVVSPVLVIEASPGTVTPDPRPPAGSASGDGLPEAEAEAERIFRAIKAGDFSDGVAADELFERLRGTGDPFSGNAAYNAGVIRYANGDCSGAAEAFGESLASPGTDEQIRLRADAYVHATDGCAVPIDDFIGG